LAISEIIFSIYRKSGHFGGRASRAEFWTWWVFYLAVTAALGVIVYSVDAASLFGIAMVLILALWIALNIVPQLAVSARRLHDTGRSGWIQMTPAAVFILGYLVSAIFSTEGSTSNLVIEVLGGIAALGVLALLALPATAGENIYGTSAGEETRIGDMTDTIFMMYRRLALGLVTLIVVSLVIFSAVQLLPGDFAEERLGQAATPEAVAAIRAELGLDQPAHTRYIQWLGRALQGDFGTAFSNNRPVAEQLSGRFANTLFLALVAAAIAVPLSLTIGILAALFRNSIFDRVANVATLTSISSPEFFVAYVLMLFLAVMNPIFPSLSNISDGMGFFERLDATMLPALTLTMVVTAHMMRMTRASIINLLASPYIEMARLKGISPARIIVVHALPNALAPIINVIALNLAYLITGVVVVEVVFVYPGVGQFFVDAVKIRDIPVVQASCLIFAAAYILLNLTADVLSILSNPRLRHPK